MGRTVVVRGPGRGRPCELPRLSSATPQITQQPEDPDLSLSAPFPITKESFYRKAIRDLTGQTFVKQRLPLFLSLFKRETAEEDTSHESFVSSGAAKMARFLAVYDRA